MSSPSPIVKSDVLDIATVMAIITAILYLFGNIGFYGYLTGLGLSDSISNASAYHLIQYGFLYLFSSVLLNPEGAVPCYIALVLLVYFNKKMSKLVIYSSLVGWVLVFSLVCMISGREFSKEVLDVIHNYKSAEGKYVKYVRKIEVTYFINSKETKTISGLSDSDIRSNFLVIFLEGNTVLIPKSKVVSMTFEQKMFD